MAALFVMPTSSLVSPIATLKQKCRDKDEIFVPDYTEYCDVDDVGVDNDGNFRFS